MAELSDYERAVGLAARRLMHGEGGADPTAWECAVGFAVRLLEVGLRPVVVQPGKFTMPRSTRTPFVGRTLEVRLDYERMTPDELAQEVSTRAGEIQVRERIAELNARGEPIEGDALRAYAARLALGEPVQPRRKGQPPDYGDYARKRAVKRAVALIVEKGWLKRTRNDATNEARSACDAVVFAASLLGESMNYDQVRKIDERA